MAHVIFDNVADRVARVKLSIDNRRATKHVYVNVIVSRLNLRSTIDFRILFVLEDSPGTIILPRNIKP